MMQLLIKILDLCVSFKTRAGFVEAVRGVTLEINKGEVLALVGESGCGKSVTAQSILKLIPSPPGKISRGKILFNGEDLLVKGEKELQSIRGKDIGFIFQDPMTSLNPTMKVGSQITEVLKRHGHRDNKNNRERVLELFNLVGIPNSDKRIDQYPHQFSGGMRQRVMLAMSLACGPKLLIADEPTTAVDVTIQAQIIELLKELQKKLGMCVLLITHDLALVAGFAQRVAVMYAGKIVETGETSRVINRPAHPYTRGLLASVPRLDASPGQELLPIPGRPPLLIDPGPGCLFWPRCPEAMNICTRAVPQDVPLAQGGNAACWLLHPQSMVSLGGMEL